MIGTLFLGFAVCLAAGIPVAFSIGLSSLFVIALTPSLSLKIMITKTFAGMDSFPLMAIPLFMLAGQLMLRGGIMERLIDFANSVVGRVRGGLAHVTVVAAMGLSSVSGTAVADATALGGTLGPALIKSYSKGFGASVVASSSNLGPIIPPSAGMIVYAIMAED
ncbi:MAG: TRAP transporter large permease subunit, partial [candidate division NC10 bacterium]|nr:TRAP transporter large permease subunit [candidate division NC10 bacterium]